MQMDEGMDTGPVLAVERTVIAEEETAGELAERLAQLAAEVVEKHVGAAVRGDRVPVPQDPTSATAAPLLSKQDGRIDWAKSCERVHDHIRGMTPWPGAFTQLDGKTLKILASRRAALNVNGAPPGTVLVADPQAVLVACGSGALRSSPRNSKERRPTAHASSWSGARCAPTRACNDPEERSLDRRTAPRIPGVFVWSPNEAMRSRWPLIRSLP